jgi:xanthine dehydrogenase YagS FAD-binding subunit
VAVALQAFDAVVHTVGPDGSRSIAIDDFFLEPGDTPQREHPLAHGELIVGIDLPAAPIASRSIYLKFRDRQSYEFALVSIAAALDVQDGIVTDARIALGGIATKPWRARRAESRLIGEPATSASFARAADAELVGAVVRDHNAFKVELAKRALARALTHIMSGGPR